jgi:hypothetical protein
MARDRERIHPLPPQQGTSVLRAGVRLIAPERLVPYDETPWSLSTTEAFAELKVAAGSFGVSVKTLGDRFSSLGGALTRASGKNHSLDQLKKLQENLKRGDIVWVAVDMNAPSVPPFKQTGRQFKPKRKRVTDHEPFYIKYEKKRRR